ncbi:MAG: [FeFe] hydrogenase H-cluster radical SAM maturase HydE [Lachnospiraceae bacterium]|nr:[FeFe] hydrogenase H-cluster radical SAM maturase HydE [Lachnospiraceae bacterium]
MMNELLFRTARNVAQEVFGNRIYKRGLIEFSSYCKNDCYYCGIRRSNQSADRYRLTKDQILSCCESGYRLGFRTFVLQGGEDPYYSDERMLPIVSEIREKYPDCAITLSLGERSYESYKRLFEAGANRYLLRHEAADPNLYRKLHPEKMSLENREECLWNLKDIGYQVGTGFMVGVPGQTEEALQEDIAFIRKLCPEMIGIGPYINHKDTPLAGEKNGTLEQTLKLLAIFRIMFPHALIPATTALGTIHPRGREMGIMAGANVVMPNLSPVDVRKKYLLYDNKICTGEEAAECQHCLQRRMESIGYQLVEDRGDYHV